MIADSPVPEAIQMSGMYPGGQTTTRNESGVDRGTFLAVKRKGVSTVGVVTTRR
jgi:hypothetical protein